MTNETRPSTSLFAKHPWMPFVVPFALYMLLTQFEPPIPELPVPDSQSEGPDNSDTVGPGRFSGYPLAYVGKVTLTLLALAVFAPIYLAMRQKVNSLALGIGAIGGAVWIGLVKLQPAVLTNAVESILGGGRPGFDPYTHFEGATAALTIFLAFRLVGIGLLIPVIEELFLRGFFVRIAAGSPFDTQPIRQWSWNAVIAVSLYAVATHPGSELLAAIVWFNLITLLVYRTGNIWDAIAAHSVTNLILAVYVLTTKDWQLW